MVHLASRPEGEKVPLAALAHATGVSEGFLSRVLQRLVHNGMVSSNRGTGGGFCLKELPDQTRLLEVIEAIEGPPKLNVCLGSGQGCDREGWCGSHSVWQQARDARADVLGSVTIAELARASTQNLQQLEVASINQGETVVTELE
jgi:Rrf2 family protein